MTEFTPLLDALRKFKASGDAGFEGLIRDCLQTLSQRTLRLQKSGAQRGQDFRSDTDFTHPLIAIEAKRFGATTTLPADELKSKLRETLESSPPPDLWGVVLSREMKQPDWSELEAIGAEYGVTLLCLDWREAPGTLPATVPIAAVGSDGDGNFVYTITDNRITRLAVKTGLTDNGRVEVTAGLSEETPVVASTKGVPPLRTAVQPQMVRENS